MYKFYWWEEKQVFKCLKIFSQGCGWFCTVDNLCLIVWLKANQSIQRFYNSEVQKKKGKPELANIWEKSFCVSKIAFFIDLELIQKQNTERKAKERPRF